MALIQYTNIQMDKIDAAGCCPAVSGSRKCAAYF